MARGGLKAEQLKRWLKKTPVAVRGTGAETRAARADPGFYGKSGRARGLAAWAKSEGLAPREAGMVAEMQLRSRVPTELRDYAKELKRLDKKYQDQPHIRRQFTGAAARGLVNKARDVQAMGARPLADDLRRTAAIVRRGDLAKAGAHLERSAHKHEKRYSKPLIKEEAPKAKAPSKKPPRTHRVLKTGKRGGRYVIGKGGTKVYVKG